MTSLLLTDWFSVENMKIFFNHKEELWNSWSHAFGIVLAVVAGTVFIVWCSLAVFKPLMDSVSPIAIGWIIAEGVACITGALFYTFNRRRFMHTVFHFFVLIGSVCHIIAVWDILVKLKY